MEYSSEEDYLLIDLAIKGDHQAFKELVERYQNTIAQVVKGILGDCPEAEDVGQEVFIKFYKSMNKFKKQAKLKTYLTRIAINLSIDHAKKRQNSWKIKGREFNSEVNIIEYDAYKAMDDKEIINKALNMLSVDHRSIVILRLMQGYSTKETAEILKIPQGTVLSRLARSQEHLKRLLKPLMTIVL